MGRGIGYALIVLGVLLVFAGVLSGGRSADKIISERYQEASSSTSSAGTDDGIDRRWTCGAQDPIEVGRQLREEINPQAYRESAGAAYLRTKNHLFIVSRQASSAGVADTCLIRGVTAPGARLVVQAGSPFSTPEAYWRTNATVRAAGWSTTPYHVHVPTFGDWGFTLASLEPEPPRVGLYDGAPPLKFLTASVAQAATVFGADDGPRELEPSTLAHPRIVEDIRRGWRQAGE